MTRPPSLPYLMQSGGRWYFRRHGKLVRLPDPSDDGFLAAYDAAKRGRPPIPAKTTINALVDSYVISTRWERLAPRSKADYHKVLDYLRDKIGERDVSIVTRPLAIEVRDANRERARFANYVVQVLSVLCEHAIDMGWRKTNPVKGTTLLKLGEGWKPWPPKAIAAYREHASGNALLIFELCLGTGQRIGDVLKMRWSDIEDGAIRVRQGKTGNELWIPLTPRLGGVLDAAGRRGLHIVSGDDSRPLSYRRASYSVADVRRVSGADDFTIHGLRHSTASELAEAGCSDAQIQAVTGHKSLRMVARYRAGSDQKRLAKEAMKLRSE